MRILLRIKTSGNAKRGSEYTACARVDDQVEQFVNGLSDNKFYLLEHHNTIYSSEKPNTTAIDARHR